MNYVHSESQEQSSQIIERGKLIFIGMQGVIRLFALEGRKPDTEGPGVGFCTFGYAMVDLDTTLTFYVQANVPIKNLNSVRPIDTIRYELIPGGSNESNEGTPTEAEFQQKKRQQQNEQRPKQQWNPETKEWTR